MMTSTFSALSPEPPAKFSAQEPGHILFITGEYPPMSGGVGAYTSEVATALVKRGWQVSVLTSNKAQQPLPAQEMQANGVHVYPVMQDWGWHVWRAGTHWAKRVGADWLHVQYQTAAYAMNAAINFAPSWWRRQDLRVAWTYHDILVPYLFPKAGNRLRRWVTDRPSTICDLTITTNAGDQNYLAPMARNLTYIPIGSNIQTRLLLPDERSARRKLRGYADGDVVIGYFGFLNRSKGGLDLVESVARLLPTMPTLRLLMIGEQVGASDATNYAYLQEVKTAIAQHGLADRVLWTGYQEDAEVSADLGICDVLLLPYLDGASLRRGSLMAGLAHGCAIVTTTPTAPIPELVEGRDLLYVPPGDVEAAAATIRQLLHEPARLELLRRHALAVSAMFSWEGIAAAHEQCYWQLA